MKIDRMEYFIEVVKHGSINSACEYLNISQQALSQAIQAIEKEVGEELLYRTRQGVTLTRKGSEFYVVATKILSIWEKFICSQENDFTKGTIKFSVGPFLEEYYYTALLAYIERFNYDIQVELYNYSEFEAIEALEAGKLDVAVISIPKSMQQELMEEHPTLAFKRKHEFYPAILLSPQSDLLNKENITGKDLQNMRCFIENTAGVNSYAFQSLLDCYPMLNIVLVNSLGAIHRMVSKNLGFTIGVKDGTKINRMSEKLVEYPMKGYDSTISGILYSKENSKEMTLKLIEKAW